MLSSLREVNTCENTITDVVFLLFFFLAVQSGMQNLSSRPGIELVSPEVEAWSLNHWTTREVPVFSNDVRTHNSKILKKLCAIFF